jgi:hypothetical protein
MEATKFRSAVGYDCFTLKFGCEFCDSSNTQIHDCSLSWLGTGTAIKGGGDKLVLWYQDIPS